MYIWTIHIGMYSEKEGEIGKEREKKGRGEREGNREKEMEEKREGESEIKTEKDEKLENKE